MKREKVYFLKILLFFCLLLGFIPVSFNLLLGEEILVTATRLTKKVPHLGAKTIVITKKNIRNSGVTNLVQLLQQVTSLSVTQTGGFGGNSSVFLRGANSNQTLVLVDGIEFNDPNSPGRSANLADIPLEDVERIEIIEGPQSPLYGSDATAGVINIITTNRKKEPTTSLTLKGGSLGTHSESILLSEKGNRFSYQVNLSNFQTDNISAASEVDGNSEKDGYKNKNFSFFGKWNLSPFFSISSVNKYFQGKSQIDNYGGPGGDDPNNIYNSKHFLHKTTLVYSKNNWEEKLSFSYTQHKRFNYNAPDSIHPQDSLMSAYRGILTKLNWQHDIYLKKQTLSFGIEKQEEKADSFYYSFSAFGPYSTHFPEKEIDNIGYYFQDIISCPQQTTVTLGIRRDNHDLAENKTTYKVSLSHYFDKKKNTEIKANYGTGFKYPSLYQLYSNYGDTALLPEESKNWDLGIVHLFPTFKVEISYFRNKFENLIDFDNNSSKYYNHSKAKTYGWECSFSSSVRSEKKKFNWNLSYANLTAKDELSGERLLRRPKTKCSLDLSYRFNKSFQSNLNFLYVGNRDDMDYSSWPAQRVTLDSYKLVSLAFNYQQTKKRKIFLKVYNLLDEDYQEIKGYGVPGRTFILGTKLSW